MKYIVVLFFCFYCTASFAVLNIPNEEPGSWATVTVDSPQVRTQWNGTVGGGFTCTVSACLEFYDFAGTDTSGVTTWVRKSGGFEFWAIKSCDFTEIAKELKGRTISGVVMSSGPRDNLTPPAKGSYRVYGTCRPHMSSSYFDWSTLNQPWDGIPPPMCWLVGPDVINFGELTAVALPGKSKKARYTISCNKKATVKVTFAFASGESTAKIADDLTLALKVGTRDGATGQTYTIVNSVSAVAANLDVAMKSGGAAPVGEYQASAVVKLTVE